MSEAENQSGAGSAGGEPIAHARIENIRSGWRAVAGGGILALIATLFIALGISNRDYAKATADNLRGIVETWNRNYEKLADRVYELEKWAWQRGKR